MKLWRIFYFRLSVDVLFLFLSKYLLRRLVKRKNFSKWRWPPHLYTWRVIVVASCVEESVKKLQFPESELSTNSSCSLWCHSDWTQKITLFSFHFLLFITWEKKKTNKLLRSHPWPGVQPLISLTFKWGTENFEELLKLVKIWQMTANRRPLPAGKNRRRWAQLTLCSGDENIWKAREHMEK